MMPRLTAFLASGCLVAALAAPATKEDLAQRFNEACDYFSRASQVGSGDPARARELYTKALRRFEHIEKEGGVHNGQLFYNIGNCYFRLGDLGRAILYYRRAELYLPHDLNVRQNLAYARSRRRDRFPVNNAAGVLRTVILFWHYDLSLPARTVCFAFAFCLIWILAAVRLFRPRIAPRWLIAGCVALALMFGGSIVADTISKTGEHTGVVIAPEVVARKGDGKAYQPSFKTPLHSGTEFVVVETRGDWLQIELPDARRCWIPRTAAGLVKP